MKKFLFSLALLPTFLLASTPAYQGGPILHSPTVYLIFYGDLSGHPNLVSRAGNLATYFEFSNVFTITGSYYDVVGTTTTAASNQLFYGGSYTDYDSVNCGSQGCALTGTDPTHYETINGIVLHSLVGNGGTLPLDTNGIYVVYIAGNVTLDGFSNGNCAFHHFVQTDPWTGTTLVTAGIRVSSSACVSNGQTDIDQSLLQPNNDLAIDYSFTNFGHEMMEAITDPYQGTANTAWSPEIVDPCSSPLSSVFYGPLSTDSNGHYYNASLGSYNYLLEQAWEPVANTSDPLYPGVCWNGQ